MDSVIGSVGVPHEVISGRFNHILYSIAAPDAAARAPHETRKKEEVMSDLVQFVPDRLLNVLNMEKDRREAGR